MTTVAENNGGRWCEYINKFIGDWEYVSADIEHDYQGSCAIIGYTGDWYNHHQYALAEWSYGSCGGCDGYEDMGEGERLQSFLRQIEFVDEETMLKMAQNVVDTIKPDGYWRDESRLNMYRKVIDFINKKRSDPDRY